MKGCMQGTVWIEPEYMLHVMGKAQYVDGVLQGVVRVDAVCIGRTDWDSASFF